MCLLEGQVEIPILAMTFSFGFSFFQFFCWYKEKTTGVLVTWVSLI